VLQLVGSAKSPAAGPVQCGPQVGGTGMQAVRATPATIVPTARTADRVIHRRRGAPNGVRAGEGARVEEAAVVMGSADRGWGAVAPLGRGYSSFLAAGGGAGGPTRAATAV